MNSDLKKDLIKIIKQLDGTLISVCVSDSDIENEIKKNDKINKAYNLESGSKKYTRKEKKQGSANITIKKLHKKVKENLDYMICDINGINSYLRKLISSSYNTINKKIIYYGMYDEYEIDKIKTKYLRYNASVKVKKYDDWYLVDVDTSCMKFSKLKKIGYSFIDFFIDLTDAIGNGLMQ